MSGAEVILVIHDGPERDADLEANLLALGAVAELELGAETVDAVCDARPRLIVLDVPRGSAAILDLIPRIASRLGTFGPPVLAVIDPEDGELMDRAFAQGAADVLQRPVAAPLLRVKVQQKARVSSSPGAAIGGYSILRVLGRGGMGTVFLSERDGQRYALKVLDANASADAEALARFRREMDSLRALRGPGIPRFYEAGRTADSFFYVMEYVEGETLSEAIVRAPLDDAKLRTVIVDIARALHAMHATQLIHRDVKPGNIILTTDGRAMLIDYGLAKFESDFSLTRRDEVMGTILYMAPEIIRGKDAGPPSDAFSLGMTALHAAQGFAPLDGTAAHVARRIMAGDVPRATGRLHHLSPELADVIDGLLEADPARRLGLEDAQRRLAPDPSPETPAETSLDRVLVLALTILDGVNERRIELQAPCRVVLGRAKECDIELFAERVSRRHCSIVLDANGATFKDLGSANGTFVNGAPVKLGTLRDGDRLKLAETQIQVELKDRSRRPATAELEMAAVAREKGEVHVPGYELVGKIGTGASASVFEARSTRTGETVAIKVIAPRVEPSAEERRRFLREGATASALVHPNIVRVIERGEFAGTFFLVMEYVPGETLHSYCARSGPLPVSVALHVARQLAYALELARTCGIVHRDVKPENVLLQPDGTAKLADFGLAKSVLDANSVLTRQGDLLGTLSYMAPEQFRSAATADHRADIYALGATLYHLLAGQPPFADATTPRAFLARVFDTEPKKLSTLRPDVPPVVTTLVDRCLMKEPDRRPRTAGEIARLAGQLLASTEQKDTVSDY